MIAIHQPSIFGPGLTAACSDVSDGDMLVNATGSNRQAVLSHRQAFLTAHHCDPAAALRVRIDYQSADFRRYRLVSGHDVQEGVITADALATTDPTVVLFLGLADCQGVILYDRVHRAVMVSHIGRHSAEQQGAAASVQFMSQTFGSSPADLLVWLSPAVGSATYPLFAYDGQSLASVNRQQLRQAGVREAHLEEAKIDTAVDERYFSHSEFLKGHRTQDGRFAIIAKLNP